MLHLLFQTKSHPEAHNQWINGRVFSAPIFSKFEQQHLSSPPQPLTPLSQYLYPACAGAKTCLPCLYYIWIMLWIKVALDMAATLWTPTIQVSLEKVHKTGKPCIFWENTWRDLERRLPRGEIAYYLEFLTLKSFFTYLPSKQRGANRPPPHR